MMDFVLMQKVLETILRGNFCHVVVNHTFGWELGLNNHLFEPEQETVGNRQIELGGFVGSNCYVICDVA